jgi:hypothetical protein
MLQGGADGCSLASVFRVIEDMYLWVTLQAGQNVSRPISGTIIYDKDFFFHRHTFDLTNDLTHRIPLVINRYDY